MKKKIRIMFVGIDYWSRPCFKDDNGNYYGSLDYLFDSNATEDKVLSEIGAEHLEYFGRSFECEPNGGLVDNLEIVQLKQFKKDRGNAQPSSTAFHKYYCNIFLLKDDEDINLVGVYSFCDREKDWLDEFNKLECVPDNVKDTVLKSNDFGLILVNVYDDGSLKIIRGEDIFLYKVR